MIKNLDQDHKKVTIKKKDTYESACVLYEGRQLTLNAFKSRIFSLKATQGKLLKLLAPKQMLQGLTIALARVIHLKIY